IARAPLRIRFEAAAGKHDRLCGNVEDAAVLPDLDAPDPDAVMEQLERPAAIEDVDAPGAGDRGLAVHQPRAAAPGFDGKSAPELELAVDLEGLAAIDGLETHALGAQPFHRLEAAADQQLAQRRIG